MRTNNELLNNFLSNLQNRGKSPYTILNYESDIIQMIKYINKGDDIDKLNKEFFNNIQYQDLDFYVNYLTANNNSPSTRGRKISAIKEFFKYLRKINIINNDPTLELETPKIPLKNPKFLNVQESRDVLKTIGGRNKKRDLAIVTLFLNLGLRVSELVGIDVADIKDERVRIIRKGNEERYLPLNKACIKAINDYLEIRPDVEEKALFLSERGSRIAVSTVRYMTNKYADVSPHTLRHTSFTNLLATKKVNLRELQELANHKSIQTTSRYTHITDDEIKDVINANPY